MTVFSVMGTLFATKFLNVLLYTPSTKMSFAKSMASPTDSGSARTQDKSGWDGPSGESLRRNTWSCASNVMNCLKMFGSWSGGCLANATAAQNTSWYSEAVAGAQTSPNSLNCFRYAWKVSGHNFTASLVRPWANTAATPRRVTNFADLWASGPSEPCPQQSGGRPAAISEARSVVARKTGFSLFCLRPGGGRG